MKAALLGAAAAVALRAGSPPAVPPQTVGANAASAAGRGHAGRDRTRRKGVPALGPGVSVRDSMAHERTGWAQLASPDGARLFVVSGRLAEGPRDARELEAVTRRYAGLARPLPARFSERSGKGASGPTRGFTLFNADPVAGSPAPLGSRPAADANGAAAQAGFEPARLARPGAAEGR